MERVCKNRSYGLLGAYFFIYFLTVQYILLDAVVWITRQAGKRGGILNKWHKTT